MSGAEGEGPLDPAADAALLAPLAGCRRVLIAVSGGPDSTALLFLARRWRGARDGGPQLLAATVDHGLRPEAAAEAAAVARRCAQWGVPHRILAWTGTKPQRGIQAAAREARHRLLRAAAADAGADALAFAHTLDDQAETVLFRLARGSGLTGLSAMRPAAERADVVLLRPLLGVPKARLVATLEAAGVTYARDPGNQDPRFTRPRLRALAPALAAEGLDARRLALLARRAGRADAALEAVAADAKARLVRAAPADGAVLAVDRAGFAALPEEIAIRLLGHLITAVGSEGPVELGKLEALAARLAAALAHGGSSQGAARFSATLAGALVSARGAQITVRRAPPRRRS